MIREIFHLGAKYTGLSLVFAIILLSNSTARAESSTVVVKAYARHVNDEVLYHYSVTNNTPNNIAAVWVGQDNKNDNIYDNDIYELQELPLGWDYDLGIPAGSATSPAGWGVILVSQEENPYHALAWNIDGEHTWDLLPGQTLQGLSVTLARPDPRYLSSHAKMIFSNRTPSTLTVPIELVDTTPPVLSVGATPSTIWPPNGKPVSVDVTIAVQDDYDPNPEIKLESITATEPLLAGDIADAQFGTDDRSFSLNAKREGGNKLGRVYTINYSATDASGNKATATAQVTVPHDQRK